jgi:hypothetical protein
VFADILPLSSNSGLSVISASLPWNAIISAVFWSVVSGLIQKETETATVTY